MNNLDKALAMVPSILAQIESKLAKEPSPQLLELKADLIAIIKKESE